MIKPFYTYYEEDTVDKLVKEKKIAVFGARIVAVEVASCLMGKPYNLQISHFIVSQVEKNPSELFGRPVISLDEAKNLVRPLNMPKGVPGKGYVTIRYNQLLITVFQVMGRTFMNTALDCPFQRTEELLKEVPSDIYICDFHGEATSEKLAFANYFDGRIQVIVGTHTHVQTNDAHLLPKGTMYMTDLGMTGPLDGIIGVDPTPIIKRFLTGMPVRHIPMETGRKQLNGLIVEINESSHKVTNFEIVNVIK